MNTITLIRAATTEVPTAMLAIGAIVTFALGMVAGILLMLTNIRRTLEDRLRMREQDDLAPWRHDRTEH